MNTATATESLCLSTRDTKFRVSRFLGEINDIALMTGDREATGHGIWIDQKTLETGLATVAGQGGRLRAVIKHPSLLDQLNGGTDRVLDFPGYFSDVGIRGNQLVAGKLQFYDSFKEEHPAEFKRLLEMAEKTPDLFGVSVEIGGFVNFIGEDGEEYSEKPSPEVALKYEGMPAFRITSLPTASFVDRPAANDNLFARFSRLIGHKPDLASLRKIAASFVEWAEKHDPEHKEIDMSKCVITDLKPGAAFDAAPNGEMVTLSTLRERITDKARLARALAVLVEHEGLSAEAIEHILAAQDKDAELHCLRAAATTDAATIEQLRVDITTAVAKAAEFEALLTAANTTNDAWQAKYVALKNSGLADPVKLGAGAGAIIGQGDDVLAQYEALSGKEKTAFFKKHKDAIWAAKEAARV